MHQLKKSILQELPQLWKQSSTHTEKYVSHSWHLPRLPLSPLVPRISIKSFGLWRTPGGEQEILALLPLKFFGNAGRFKKMYSLLEENPQLTFFGGQYFSSTSSPSYEWAGFGNHHYFLPALCFETTVDKTTLTLTWPREMAKNSIKQADFIFNIKQALEFTDESSQPLISGGTPVSICSQERWSQIVNTALEHIHGGKFKKVVLARKEIIELQGKISPRTVFEYINKSSSEHNYTYYLQVCPNTAFISMTPERLFELTETTIKTDALAGTRPRGKNPDEDERMAEELLNSEKERHEHELVVSFLKNQLEKLSVPVNPSKLRILKLPHVQHLWTPLTGTVSSACANVESLLSYLHPTPAVAGWPTDEALDFIKQKEPFQRGLYASPIGVIQKNFAHFATAIRSALVYHNKIHLYAGSGIVKDSRGMEEWKETWSKMQNFQKLF